MPLTSWPRFGADRTPSPDVRSGHPGLRSLGADCAPASCLRRPIRLRRIGARATPALGARPAPHGFCMRNSQLQRARGWSFALPLNPSTTPDEIIASGLEPVEDQIPVSLVATRFPSCRRHVQVENSHPHGKTRSHMGKTRTHMGKLAPTWENLHPHRNLAARLGDGTRADTAPES